MDWKCFFALEAAKKAKSDHQEADADSDYSSSEEGFDVSDEPFDVNVEECSEDFYEAHCKGVSPIAEDSLLQSLF